ncbi:class F sortase [Blastococcus goldschmidtiae]|uniref:Class F sortase n=1 Tax=Blastococcus goldschmidtiae TaxID=3075546 RepID=A0ABU2KC34_9ACTN|nr:class F sortase [Blastococcus sp. DSM 46792]MDT0277749.1 class F sortase [Blastococcus sp. DSM 46792]
MGPAQADGETGLLRIAHLSPDTPAVDVALTPAPAGGPAVDPGPDVAGALGYGEVGGYRALPAGSYAVSVRPAGTFPGRPPALSAVVDVPAGGARTLALSGTFAELALTPLPDDLTAPADGTARVRVLAAAATAPTLDVLVDNGPALAAGLPFAAESGYTAVPAGPATVRLTSGADGTAVPVDLAAGTVVSLLVLDAPGGGLTVRTLVDAVAPAVRPVGGVEAGGSTTRAARFPRLSAAVAAAAHDRAAGDGLPVRVRVPAAGVDAAVTGSGLETTGALTVPADPAVAGWYAAGPAPGRPGPAVLAGHVDWTGRPAVFAGLDRLVPGDEIAVDRADGTSVRFAVDRVVRSPKDAFPTDAVYGPVSGAELRLITCGGVFDPAAGSYRDNLVVFARLVG